MTSVDLNIADSISKPTITDHRRCVPKLLVSAKGANHHSLGQRPRTAGLNLIRAESPSYQSSSIHREFESIARAFSPQLLEDSIPGALPQAYMLRAFSPWYLALASTKALGTSPNLNARSPPRHASPCFAAHKAPPTDPPNAFPGSAANLESPIRTRMEY